MERFELTIVAHGQQSIWIALLVVIVLCMTALGVAYMIVKRPASSNPSRRTRS